MTSLNSLTQTRPIIDDKQKLSECYEGQWPGVGRTRSSKLSPLYSADCPSLRPNLVPLITFGIVRAKHEVKNIGFRLESELVRFFLPIWVVSGL